MFQLAAFRVIPQWFEEEQRGAAFGIFFSSLGLGGIAVPLIATAVESRFGGPWIFRILAISAFVFGSITCIFITSNRQAADQLNGDGGEKKATDLSVIKTRNMGLYVTAIFIQTCVQIIPNMFLPSYAKYIGLKPWQANMTTVVLLGMTIPGALLAGVLADRLGCLNTVIMFTAMAALTTSTIWTFAYTFEALEAYCAVYGLFANVMLTLNAPVVISIVGIERYPSAISLVLLTNLLSAFGPTAASGIEGISRIEPYLSYKVFVSTGFVASLIIQLIVRVRKEKPLFVKV
ncbi:major facilitator superfamily domain-containing protein [Fennellomyces sp. T-0311]|nr:major facilitator superfamily domain-containing protein [Fennellomyces sp. T-0311]